MRSTKNADHSTGKTDVRHSRRTHIRWRSKARGNYNYYKKCNGPINEGDRIPQHVNIFNNFNDPGGNERCIPPLMQITTKEFDKGIDNAQENSSLYNNAPSVSSPYPPERTGLLANSSTSCNVSSYYSFSSQIPETISTPEKSLNNVSSGQVNINENNQNEAQLLERGKEINKMTIIELIQQVCSEPGADETNIADRFFRSLVSTLLSLTDSCPEQKSFVYKILSALVNVGLSYAQNQDEPELQQNESIKKHKTATTFKLLQSLVEVDLLIQALMKQKLDIYNNIYQALVSDHIEQRGSSKVLESTIDRSSVQKSIDKVKSEIVQTNTSFNEIQVKMLSLPEIGAVRDCESQVNQLLSTESLNPIGGNDESLVQNSFLRLPCRSDASISSDNIERGISNQKVDQVCISYGALQGTEILCFSLYDKAIIAGYQNGTLRIFNLESGALLDNVKPHKNAVTSIHVWQDVVITTSLDGTMKLYDLAHHTSKMVIVGEAIFTSCLFKGILYLGSSNGSVFRLYVKNMKQISNPFCVCLKTVNTILVVEEKSTLLMFIAAEDSAVCIRDGTTGSLIQVFTQLPNAKCIVVLGQLASSSRICAGFNDKMLATKLHSCSSNSITKLHSVSCLIVHRGILFAATQDHNIFMYDEQTIDLLNNPLDVSGEIKTMAVWGKFLIVATSTSGISYLEIPKIVLDRWSNYGKE